MEMIVVTAILAVLVGLLLGGVQAARQSAARVEALNATRQLLLATQAFADTHAGMLPNADGAPPNQGDTVSLALCTYLGVNQRYVLPPLFHGSGPVVGTAVA